MSCLWRFTLATTNQDSLYTVWQNDSLNDSVRVDAYNKYVWQGFLFSKPDSAFFLAKNLITFGAEFGCPRATALGYNTQGVSRSLRGNFVEALHYYIKYEGIYARIEDKRGLAKSHNNIANVYYSQGEYPKALKYYTKSLEAYQYLNDEKGIATVLNNIGNIYSEQGDLKMHCCIIIGA